MGLQSVITEVIQAAQGRMWTFALLALRASVVVAVSPWPGRLIPNRVKGLFVLSAAITVSAALPEHHLYGQYHPVLWTAFLAEMFYGAALGFSIWVALSAVIISGQVAGLQMGFGLRAALDPASGSSMNAVAQMAVLAWMPIALEFGLHHHLLRALAVPPAILSPANAVGIMERAMILADASLANSQNMFTFAVIAAAPVFALSALSYAGLGAISRAVPQAMVIGEALGGAAVLGMTAIAISALSWPSLIDRTLAPILEAFGVH